MSAESKKSADHTSRPMKWSEAVDLVLITRAETANLLRISVRSLDRLVADGEITSTLIGRKRLFRPKHVKQFAESCAEASLADKELEAQAIADRIALDAGLVPYRGADLRPTKQRRGA